MALKYIDMNEYPAYLALSSDIVDDKITGATIVGATVYLTDTETWKIITDDLTLVEFSPPFPYVVA